MYIHNPVDRDGRPPGPKLHNYAHALAHTQNFNTHTDISHTLTLTLTHTLTITHTHIQGIPCRQEVILSRVWRAFCRSTEYLGFSGSEKETTSHENHPI